MRKFWNKLTMLVVICISSYATAQNINEKKGLQASAIIGISNFNFGSINDVLENQGLPQIKDGLQFTPSFNITLFSGNRDYWEVAVGLNNSKSNENGYTLEQQVIFSEIGYGKYINFKERNYLLFGVAIGNVSYDVDLYNNVKGTSFFDSISQTNDGSKISSRNNTYAALKAGYDWEIDSERDILIGVRMGYRIGFGKEKWEINGNSHDDSPKTSANGFFMGLALSIH